MSKRKFWMDYFTSILTAILIIYFAIINKQSFLKTLPTLITLIVQLLNVSVNRYTFLLGGANAVLYAISYLSEGIYFSFFSTILISAPMQFYSFINWSTHTEKRNTDLKRLTNKKLFSCILLTIAGWILSYLVLTPHFKNAAFPVIDALCFAMGITVSVLAARRYIESQYMNALTVGVNIIFWVLITIERPSNLNYLIIACYNLFRVVEASVIWTKKYKCQSI